MGEAWVADERSIGLLTYTSFDGAGAGGWQVKEQSGLSDAEATALRARVATQLDPGYEMPRFPSPDDVARLPRRLAYGPLGQAVGWWHTAPAGSDASGRPGNVFAQMLLDRIPRNDDSLVRPIDLWRSPDWLTPYGADAVREATLRPGHAVRPGPAVSAAAVVGFLFDLDHFRFGVLGALLDAVAEAMADGRRVVLGTESVDSAALWIGAVTHLMPAQWARRCYFSTLERAATIAASVDQGLHVICVPRTDLEQLSSLPRPLGEQLVVIDEAEDIDIGDLGDDGQGGRPHRTAGGFAITTTEWSAMAQVVCFDEHSAAEAIRALDAMMLGLVDTGTVPSWGLALVISRDQEQFGDAKREAANVLTRFSPAGGIQVDALMTGARGLIREQLGTTTEEAWQLLSRLAVDNPPTTQMMRIAVGIYAARALADLPWLLRAGGVPLTAGIPVQEAEVGALADIAQRTLDLLLAPGYERDACAGVAALTNLCARLGLTAQPLAENLRVALDRTVIFELFEPGANALVQQLGLFDEVTQSTFLRDQVELAPGLQTGRPGTRMDPQVTFWLYPSLAEPVAVDRLAVMDGYRLRAELAVCLVRWKIEDFAMERPLAVWATLFQLELELEHDVVSAVIEEFFAGPPWSPAEALAIESRFPDRLPSALLSETVKTAPPSASLVDLSRTLTGRFLPPTYDPVDTAVRFVAALRIEEDRPWFDAIGAAFDQSLGHVILGGFYGMELSTTPFSPSTVSHLRTGMILASVLGRHLHELPMLRQILGAGLVLTQDEIQMVTAGLSVGNVSVAQVAFTAVMSSAKFPVREQLSDPRFEWVGGCVVGDGAELAPVLVHFLRRTLDEHPVYEHQLGADVRAHVATLLDQRVDNRERMLRATERFTQDWVKDVRSAEGRLGRRKARF